MAGPSGFGNPTQPEATFAMLHGLKPALESAFPINDSSIRPDTGEDDSEQGQTELAQRGNLIRVVLGGWMVALDGEQGQDGSHTGTNSDSITSLSDALPRPLPYLSSKPYQLLFRPQLSTTDLTRNQSKLNEGLELLEPEQDLATFFFPRILSCASSLETALVLDPKSAINQEADSIYKKRENLRTILENFLASIIKILVDSAVSLEWERKGAVVSGGIGKARDLVQEMTIIIKNALMLIASPTTQYPQKLQLFGSASPRSLNTAADPFDRQPSLTLHSNIHARGMILTTLRMLLKITASSLFFADFIPIIHNLLGESWPSLRTPHDVKGKQKMDENKWTVIEATMSISLKALENLAAPFSSAVLERIVVRVGELYRFRLSGQDNGMNFDSQLMRMYSKLWERVVGSGIESNLRQTISTLILENSQKMVECLVNPESNSAELQMATMFILAAPFSAPTDTVNFATVSTIALLTARESLALATFATTSPHFPFLINDRWSSEQLYIVNSAWTSLRAKLLAQNSLVSSSPRKRKRSGQALNLPSEMMEIDVGDTTEELGNGKKKKWRESVTSILSTHLKSELKTWEDEGFENFIARLAVSIPTLALEAAIQTLHVIGLLGCAREVTFCPGPSAKSWSGIEESACTLCDIPIDSKSPATPEAEHLLTKIPLEGMKKAGIDVLQQSSDPRLKLAFMQALTRLLRHSRNKITMLDLGKDSLVIAIYGQLEANGRNLRLAAGNLLLSIIRARQEQVMSVSQIDHLSKRLDVYLGHKSPAVIETTLITVGRIARLAIPQGWLECQCVTKLVCRLGHPHMYLKSVVRTQFEQIAHFRNVKPYALVQPHFETISPILVDTMQTSPATIAAALDCFQQSREAVLRLTREYTLPKLVLQDRMVIIKQIAEASERSVAVMLVDPSAAPAIFAYLYMQPDLEQRKGLTVYMREAGAATTEGGVITLHEILNSVKIPLVYRLALQLGDDDLSVRTQAERALRSVERARNPTTIKSIDLGSVLKDSIVGILSLMNRGLNESTAHRPLRSKQKIIRSLEVVTELVGPAIAGFSPQIMATLQSALEVQGLRGVALNALKTFFNSLKFGEIGPFIGTTSATFVRLWPALSAMEKSTAMETIEYIVIQNSDNLAKFVSDVADLSGIPELAVASARLQKIRKDWSFDTKSDYLLARVDSENDVVSLQALRELKQLMLSETAKLQGYTSSVTFDKSVGKLIKTLFGAATKDGSENEAIRNIAFECIGILGALDPDRFDIIPPESPTIILQNFSNRDEGINFALHLIQDLLIGAYRSTNDTKHQEVLAYAIQELLRYCGFTVELVLPSITAAQSLRSKVRERWNALPKSVLETCGPLLGTSFSFKSQRQITMTYPIYSTTTSYRDWIRSWATDLISKIKESKAKEIFDAFPPVLRLEDIAVAQHLLPHLALTVLISGPDKERILIKNEMQKVLEDQVDPKAKLSEHSRLLSAQTVFDLMDHMSRWTHKIRQESQKRRAALKKVSRNYKDLEPDAQQKKSDEEILYVEGALQDIPQMLVAQAAFNCKAYARALLSYESRLVAARSSTRTKEADLQDCYEKLHKCYADLDEPDGMEGVTTKIVHPSIWHQIREHESTGRWTSAQSCWEVKLQQSPEDPACHIGLLQCLRNLGHYDSMRTHIVGILHIGKKNVEWERILAPFNVEASLIVGDWDAVERALQLPDLEGPQVAFGRVITAMRQGENELLEKAFYDAREQLGGPIIAAGKEGYRRIYDSVVNLHILHELQMIRARNTISTIEFTQQLAARVESTSPSFRAREPIFNMRRTTFSLDNSADGRKEIGALWLETSKIARKAVHSQTAYSAILQANNLDTPFVFLQSAKLLQSGDQMHKAIQELDNALTSLIPVGLSKATITGVHKAYTNKGAPSILAKSSLRRARWMHEAGRLDSSGIVSAYQEASCLSSEWESPYYYLGHYWDQVSIASKGNSHSFSLKVLKLFSDALSHGTKFIYQALPRMLTIWFELGDHPDLVKLKRKSVIAPGTSAAELSKTLASLNAVMDRNAANLPKYQWLTVLPQLVSRVTHENESLANVLGKILINVLLAYPHHTFWAMASGAKSATRRRARYCMKIFDRAKENEPTLGPLLDEGIKLVDQLLILCNHPVGKEATLSLYNVFPKLYKIAPTTIIIPLQVSLNVSLPSDASQLRKHKPFPDRLVTFQNFFDEIDIMTSLQKPRKITVHGDDGLSYAFLCKPKDDLRKDARLMEFNSMIIKMLKKDSESRNRRLGIRTYAVVPLNEECGLIEWVPNVVVLRTILNKAYTSRGIAAWSPELKAIFETIRDDPSTTGSKFTRNVLTKFPPVFHEWFLETFPEPSAWFRARLAYSRTAAVISIVGFVLGLGDRHCENILLEGTTGDTVHVDFNCLFDKGRSFDVGEKVPFRLTHNIIDGMGVTGVEGVFRKAAEITLRILRDNKESLTSVLETFVHDPLVEWSSRRKGKEPLDPDTIQRNIAIEARKNLKPIALKLRGLQVTSDPESVGEKEVTVSEQVERLIRDARSPANLGSMYVGWAPML